MNCKNCQRRLLKAECPDDPEPTVVAHLRGCAACREWQRRLLQVEANVPRLPVPAARAPANFVARLLSGPVPAAPSAPPRQGWNWRILAAGAAAAVVLIGSGIWLGNELWLATQDGRDARQVQAPVRNIDRADTLVARLVRCDLQLARATTPRERVEVLADLADRLQEEGRTLAQAAAHHELDRLASLYGKVIRGAIVPRSRGVPAGERQRVLGPIVDRLARARQEVEDLAKQAPGSAGPLEVMAAAAREGEMRLRGLMREVAG
jgi:hypothetical protein